MSEGGYSVRVDAGFGATGDHHVGCSSPDDLCRVSYGIRRGAAGGHHTGDRTGEIVLDRHEAGRHIGNHPGDPRWADSTRSPFIQDHDVLDERAHAAEPGTNHHPGPRRSFLIVGVVEPGICESSAGCHQEELGIAIEPSGVLLVEVVAGVPVGHFGCEPDLLI